MINMRTNYSKSSADVSLETTVLTKVDSNILASQLGAAQSLKTRPIRTHCLLCQSELNYSSNFAHRELVYLLCENCHHVQSQNVPTLEYPTDTPNGIGFLDVYPKLDEQQYRFRQNRVYKPKCDWIINSLIDAGFSLSTLQKKSWLEMGAGAGYFLNALKEYQIDNFKGVEKNSDLCGISNSYLGTNRVYPHQTSLQDVFEKYKADIYVAFFVLEHIQDAFEFFQTLAQCKIGTIFIFSVPVFSFATLLETAFEYQAGRNLDNALHTQIYTEDSIKYALKLAGFKVINQWLFGQDSADLKRVISLQAEKKYPPYLANMMHEKLNQLLDPLQEAIDKAHFCDARHLICIKEQS